MGRTQISRRGVVGGALAAAALPMPAIGQGAGGVVRVVFPFGAGGGGDAISRLMAEQIAAGLGRSVIVENRTGADGRIGIGSVKAAAPDGNTLLITTGPTMWLMPLVHKAPGYDPFKDFEPIGQLALFEFCIAVANNTGVKTLAELVAWIKANPEKATYGVPGAGTIPAFAGLSFAKAIGVPMQRLPYRGGAPAMTDLVGGQIPIVVGTLADALQQHRAGTIRVVAVASEKRSPFVPDVPTLSESGYKLVADAWYGLWAPAGTPKDVTAKLSGIVTASLQREDVRKRLLDLGMIATGTSPQRLVEIMQENTRTWAPIVAESGYTIESK